MPAAPDDKPIEIAPQLRVMLRNRAIALVTHIVSTPEPWELLGRLEKGGESLLWKRCGHYRDGLGETSPLDIVGIESAGTGQWHAFTGVTIGRKRRRP